MVGLQEKQEILEVILRQAAPILPVVAITQSDDAVALGEALLEAGLSVLEVVLRNERCLDAIALLSHRLPQLTVGAGTLCEVGQMKAAVDVGARFMVSPGVTTTLLQAAEGLEVPWLPGVLTASDILLLREYGYRLFKLFPAPWPWAGDLLSSYRGPFPEVRFCPTGGVGRENLLHYLRLPNVLCVGGSWLVPDDLMRARDWRAIADSVRREILAGWSIRS